MKKLVFLFLFLAAMPGLLSARGLRTRYADLVNPFIGTDFHGHTFPGAAYPFGMIQLSPDTRGTTGTAAQATITATRPSRDSAIRTSAERAVPICAISA